MKNSGDDCKAEDSICNNINLESVLDSSNLQEMPNIVGT